MDSNVGRKVDYFARVPVAVWGMDAKRTALPHSQAERRSSQFGTEPDATQTRGSNNHLPLYVVSLLGRFLADWPSECDSISGVFQPRTG
jgi:hypothetical protein